MADKRTVITKTAIKEGMLELLSQSDFNYITVSALCREAGVGRATFYTHYTGLTDVIDELADDAIQATKRSSAPGVSGIIQLAEKMRRTTDPQDLAPYMDLLPVCQRVADNPKYKVLFKDSFVSEYMLMNIYRREREAMLPYLIDHFNLTAEQADKIFLFGVTGAFAVNRAMGWKKDESWYQVQKVLLTFLEGGYQALGKL
ncbi:MAG: TetR/AcrR family transcriptional regulator [Oscillospiraceae bacterium]|nr:TetR/AcrR family transcriptional regulator [Oscillospiraceae bacterium]